MSAAERGSWWDVDDERISMPLRIDRDASYDVVLNERAIWSFLPSRDATREGRRLLIPWPGALAPHLTGRADVEIREHVSQKVMAQLHHVFGGDDSRALTIQDRAGRGLIVDKWGRLAKPIVEQDPAVREEILDATDRIITVIERDADLPAFISYGTLLGAVRNGRFIGHDNDVDIAYASRQTHPADIVHESFRVERALAGAGFTVRRGSGGRLNVRLKVSDGTVRGIDVFTAAWVEGILYIPSDTGFELPPSTVLPLTPVELEGRSFPGPADSDRLLAATYGPGWRTPDPSFVYETPRWLFRRLAGWYGGLSSNRKHWDAFHAKNAGTPPSQEPSAFARWVAEQHPSDRTLVDLGSGNGRDALWFAREGGRTVLGFDYSSGLKAARRAAKQGSLDARFQDFNLYCTRSVLTWGALLSREEEPVDLYGRFILDALQPVGQENIVRLASMALRRGGLLSLEFATPRNPRRIQHAGPAPRYPVGPGKFARLITSLGGEVVDQVTGTELAGDGDDELHVCRTVARWAPSTEVSPR